MNPQLEGHSEFNYSRNEVKIPPMLHPAEGELQVEKTSIIFLRQNSIFHDDSSITHFRKVFIVSDDDKSLLEIIT